MRIGIFWALLLVHVCGCSSNGGDDEVAEANLLVAAAANTQFVMREIIENFEKSEGVKVDLVIASSGKLASQIVNGAPFDVFLSANMKFPNYIHDQSYAPHGPIVYALGSLVLWSNSGIDLSSGVEVLRSSQVNKIAIANDKNAPYGTATKQALENLKIVDLINNKLVYGESISQVNQFVKTKAVDVGFTSKSVVMSKMKGTGTWADIDTAL